MTRWWCLVAAVCLITGCSHPESRARVEIPKVGSCYADVSARPVSCNVSHIAQTIFVSRRTPPSGRGALVPCRRAEADFLGQDFNTRLDLQMWVASDRSWYRCDVILRDSTRGAGNPQQLTGSLKGVLRKDVPADLQACLAGPYEPNADQPYVSCALPHLAQELFVAPAIGTLDEAFPADVADRATSACNATAAAAGLRTGDRTVTAYYPKNAAAWASGERTADCWVTATSGILPGVKARSG
jgi:Septum formation